MSNVFQRIIHKVEAGVTHLELMVKHVKDEAGNFISHEIVSVKTHTEDTIKSVLEAEANLIGYTLVKKEAK